MALTLTPASIEPAAAERVPAGRAWDQLLRASASTARLLNSRLAAAHGLSPNEYGALAALARAGGRLRRVDLAQRLALTPSGVTRLVAGLERAGFVEPAFAAEDRRVRYAQLTADGKAKLDAASADHTRAIRFAFESRLTRTEIERLSELLGKVAAAIEA